MTRDHRLSHAAADAGATQRIQALEGVVSVLMRRVAEREHLKPETIRAEVAAGRMVIPANPTHTVLDSMGIGRAARVKINANVGSSPTTSSQDEEVGKLQLAQQWGADTVMDLSTRAPDSEPRRG